MSIPFDSLTLVAPIVLIVLLVLFPVIGAIAGWKRSLYWGLGNVAFYFIGLLIWGLASKQIVGVITPLILKIMPGEIGSADISVLITSVCGPIFFIIIMLLGNLILLICYFTFVKRLLGLKKPKDKNNVKEAKTNTKNSKGQVAVKTKVGVTKSKPFNILIGGLSLGALMLPVSLSLSNIVAMTTTNSESRTKNSLCSSTYNGLQKIVKSVGKFSYFNEGKSAGDFDALFETINQSSNMIYYSYNGKNVEQDGMTAMTTGIPTVVSGFAKDISEAGEIKTEEGIDAAIESYNKMQKAWNDIISGVGNKSAGTILSSDGILTTVQSMLSGTAGIKLDSSTINEMLSDNSMYNKLKEALEHPVDETGLCEFTIEIGGQKITKHITINPETIPVTQEAFDKISDTAIEMFEFDSTVTPEQKEKVRQQSKELIAMFLSVKKS